MTSLQNIRSQVGLTPLLTLSLVDTAVMRDKAEGNMP